MEGLFEKACAGLRYAVEEGLSVGISTFATHEAIEGDTSRGSSSSENGWGCTR